MVFDLGKNWQVSEVSEDSTRAKPCPVPAASPFKVRASRYLQYYVIVRQYSDSHAG